MDKVQEIVNRLRKEYAQTETALEFENPYELLVATILAAQCTDKRVNMVTKDLFPKYPDPAALAKADQLTLEGEIHSCGFYHNKAKNLIACAKRLVDVYGGKVPNTLEELTTLAGVGRKTANVVLAFAFGIPAFPVDTHVGRVARRLGFSTSQNPDKVEADLKRIFKKEEWTQAHHWLIWHGRLVCKSQRPLCGECVVNDLCPYYAEHK